MFKTYTYRLYPNKEQEILLAKHFGCCRYVYNRALKLKTDAWKNEQKNLSFFDVCKELPKWKKDEDTKWLAEVNAQSLQASLAAVDAAYTNFFKKRAAFPKFKKKNSKQSFKFPDGGTIDDKTIKVRKLGKIKAVIDRPHVRGKIKSVTIPKTSTGKYFASVLCDDGLELPPKKPITEETTLGVDLGLTTFATLSNGVKITNPRHLKPKIKKLKRAQRALSRRVKGSKNRIKAKHILAIIHEKVSNCRKDFIHKVTTKLVNDNQVDSFCIEDLAVKDMMQNHRLAHSIGDVGWGMTKVLLKYKAERKGKNVITIGRFEPSSKMCSCGVINSTLTLKDRVWTCTSCNVTHDRDLLAAQNIKRFALHPQNLIGQDLPEFTPVETDGRRGSRN